VESGSEWGTLNFILHSQASLASEGVTYSQVSVVIILRFLDAVFVLHNYKFESVFVVIGHCCDLFIYLIINVNNINNKVSVSVTLLQVSFAEQLKHSFFYIKSTYKFVVWPRHFFSLGWMDGLIQWMYLTTFIYCSYQKLFFIFTMLSFDGYIIMSIITCYFNPLKPSGYYIYHLL
jgi:hypothetical protein